MNTPEQKVEVAELLERLNNEAANYRFAGPPHVRDLLIEATETIEALAEAVDAMGEIIDLHSSVALANKVAEWDDARRRFVDHGFMGDAHEADKLGVEIVSDARRLLNGSQKDAGGG